MTHSVPGHARAALAAALFGFALTASAQTEIQFWHSMTGALGDRVGDLAKRFNDSQKDYKVVPVFKGTYPESMAALVAATRAGNPPHIVQIFEVGTATMMASGKAIKPVYEVMALGGQKFDSKAYIPAVAGYYSTPDGRMLSFPFNSSTAVFYYNKDAFKKAGLDPNNPPKTWPAVAAAAAKLKVAGEKCGYTTGWPSWVQFENFSAWHDLPFATKQNGFAGPDAKLEIVNPLQIKHVENLVEWQKKGYFTYGGRTNEGESKFYSGECGMMTSSSAAYANVKRNAKFDFGIAPLPYYPDAPGAPQNSIIGGASLWVMNGKKPDEYKGIARFFTFLSQPELQAEWHQQTGYLPITMAAYEITKKSGFYDKNPGTNVSVEQMIVKTTKNSRGVRLGNFVQVRDAIQEELEAALAGKKSAKAAVEDGAKRGNEIIDRFNKANKAGKG
ncbi:MAG: sn-glycerol-3-phosphate ABC transporter substrate-binding protein UgpB [Burkholderiales bacterium]